MRTTALIAGAPIVLNRLVATVRTTTTRRSDMIAAAGVVVVEFVDCVRAEAKGCLL